MRTASARRREWVDASDKGCAKMVGLGRREGCGANGVAEKVEEMLADGGG